MVPFPRILVAGFFFYTGSARNFFHTLSFFHERYFGQGMNRDPGRGTKEVLERTRNEMEVAQNKALQWWLAVQYSGGWQV